MADTTPPPIGSMYLWDAIEPPLPAGQYKLTATAEARFDGTPTTEQLARDRFFNVDAPRFALPPSEVAGMVPPRNAHGPFHLSLPHVVLGRRTLPWERVLDPAHPAAPWMALLLFEEDECTILDQQPLEDVVPPEVFTRLGRPAGVLCDAVEVDHDVLHDVMPSMEEVSLLTHVRQVNVDDRELAAGDSDGWFAVVVANRLPRPGTTSVACLVSLEGRTDVVPATPPPVAPAGPTVGGDVFESSFFADADASDAVRDLGPGLLGTFRDVGSTRGALGDAVVMDPKVEIVGHGRLGGDVFGGIAWVENRARLVLLHRWKFDDDGSGTFPELMQALDVGMIGTVATSGQPVVADTGHMPLTLHGRAGVDEAVWYRGPLVPDQLSRDTLGPYHSADQARRVSPETGAEDVSYAAAFEVGRLLAAADQRLGVELMRWRRGAYHAGARCDVLRLVTNRLPAMLPAALLDALPQAVLPVLAAGVLDRVTQNVGPVADPYRTELIAGAPGLDPDLVQAAWRLPSRADAVRLLNADVMSSTVDAVETAPLFASFEEAARDAEGIARLDGARTARTDRGEI
ncbi:MAG: hypothetical protein QOH64_2641 [Acidimicrobiaceae bacterium]